MNSKISEQDPEAPQPQALREELLLQVPTDLYRAFRRCSWMITNECGRSQFSIMEEMVRDFLIKHGC